MNFVKFLPGAFAAAIFQFGLLFAPAAEPIRVTGVGDSITFGFGIGKEFKTYPQHLQEMLGAGFDGQNFGASGRTFLCTGNTLRSHEGNGGGIGV